MSQHVIVMPHGFVRVARTTSAILTGLFMVLSAGSAGAADLPARKAGLWELSKSTADDPRPLPKVFQCTDAATDASLAENAFLAEYLGCSEQSSRRDGDGWVIEATCESEAGPVKHTTRLSGDFQKGYTMAQVATFADLGMTVSQDVTAVYVGVCDGGLKPGEISVSGMAYPLPE